MALNFYNSQNGQAANGAVKPVQQAIGVNNNLTDRKVAGLTTTQLADPQWGFGSSFQAAARQGGIDALKSSFSGQNPEDAAAQGQLRDFYTQSLGNLGTLGDRRGSAFDTQEQRGLQNMLQGYQRANAGSGRLGSPQSGRAQGDITQRLSEEYTKGMNDLSGQSLQNAGQIGQGLTGINNTSLQERGFQNQQAQSLANYYLQQQQIDQNREQGLAQQKQAQQSATDQLWGSAIGAGMQGLGAAYGGGLLGGAPAANMAAQTAANNGIASFYAQQNGGGGGMSGLSGGGMSSVPYYNGFAYGR